ncbi:MAG: 4-(cytidine 5'-diphospho)-2-C-methyl-D-erythritol kinase, partial [Gemmatimonadales bacterium]
MTSAVVRLPAHAKLNLLLRVLAREEDGYHGLETVFCLISLADDLTAERIAGAGATLQVTGAETGPLEDNLAVRAARLVLEATGHRFGVQLTLTKRIPVGAGLGGGSSDAATALRAVNRLADDAVPRHELLQLAARLGSDVPFFLSGAALALAWGRGERLMRLPPLPPAPALLLVPPTAISTPQAYRWVDAARQSLGRRGAVALDLEALASWGSLGRLAGNDFESVVFGRHPDVRAGFEKLAMTHPLLCRMTGSGSTLFAVYRNSGEREDARMMLGRKHGEILSVETLQQAPTDAF